MQATDGLWHTEMMSVLGRLISTASLCDIVAHNLEPKAEKEVYSHSKAAERKKQEEKKNHLLKLQVEIVEVNKAAITLKIMKIAKQTFLSGIMYYIRRS